MKIKGLLIIALVAVLAIIGGNNLNAQTAAGTALNNTAIITAANAAGIGSDTTNTTTGQIAGASYTVVPVDTGGATGAVVPLTWTIRNDGNASDTFTIAIFAAQSNLIATPWARSFVSTTIGPLAPTATANITLNVTIDGAAPNGSYMEYEITATSANIATSVLERSYRGDNGTYYGGAMGISWAGTTTNNDGILRHGTQNTWVRVAASGPVLRLNKSIVSIQRAGAGVTAAIPGSTITYQLVISNIGSVAATSVIVRDTYPTATTYVAASGSATAGDNAGWTVTDNGTYITFTRANFDSTNGAGIGYATFQFGVTVD